MKNKRLRLAVLTAVLAVCAFLALRSTPFADFAHTDRADFAYLSGNPSGMGVERHWTAEEEELTELLAPLAESRLAPRGFTRAISYETGQWLWRFRLVHTEGEQWVQDAHFALRSDGTLYRIWPGYGYWAYRLRDADVAALNAMLQARWEAAA